MSKVYKKGVYLYQSDIDMFEEIKSYYKLKGIDLSMSVLCRMGISRVYKEYSRNRKENP